MFAQLPNDNEVFIKRIEKAAKTIREKTDPIKCAHTIGIDHCWLKVTVTLLQNYIFGDKIYIT